MRNRLTFRSDYILRLVDSIRSIRLGHMQELIRVYQECKKSEANFIIVLISYFYYKIRGKSILSHQNVSIKGLKNLETKGVLRIGGNPVGFIHKSDKTHLNISGKLVFNDNFAVGRGCRFDIGENAIASFGKGCITANSCFVIMHGLEIGDRCAISWNCQFLDDDFHEIDYSGKIKKDNQIKIGDHVWIGCNVTVLKGAIIPDGCVVAANSVVTRQFKEKNVLLAGNPATVIKRDVQWK